MSDSPLDVMTGVLGTAIVAGTTVKIVDSFIGKTPKKQVRRVMRPARKNKIKGLGNFNNVGF